MMKTRYGFLFSMVMLTLLLSGVGIAAAAPAASTTMQAVSADSTASFNGHFGPGNSLYGLMIAFENLDESFTFNRSERLEKQVRHADLRLAELELELADNRTIAAEIALEHYRQKLNQTEDTLAPFGNDTGPMFAANDTGLLHAQNMIAKHQYVLENLLASHPDNQGLARAYNNSVALDQKFALKMQARHQLRGGEENSTFVPPEDMNQTMNRNGRDPDRQAANQTQGDQQPGNGTAGNNQNNNSNAGHSRNSSNNQNTNTGNVNNNANTGTGNNNKGHAGTMNDRNSNGNPSSPDR